MIEYKELSFKEKPFTQVKHYAIHPLSEKGFNQYLSKESYARQYLNKINPKLIEEFDQEEHIQIQNLNQDQYQNENPLYYEKLINQYNNNLK